MCRSATKYLSSEGVRKPHIRDFFTDRGALVADGARRLSRGGRRAEPSDAQEAGTRRECADGPARSRLRAHNRAHRHGRRHGRGVWICIAGGPVSRQPDYQLVIERAVIQLATYTP